MNKIKINTFTDESGQDTKGKMFVVCTVITKSDKAREIEEKLLEVEKESGKTKKWHDVGNKRKHSYIKLLLKNKILNEIQVYCSEYSNKKDYVNLIASHIAKSIFDYVKEEKYQAKIFIDKLDSKTMLNLKKEIKLFHIRYKKIRGITDQSNPLIRLADAACGLKRDLINKNAANSYKIFFRKINPAPFFHGVLNSRGKRTTLTHKAFCGVLKRCWIKVV